MGAKIPYCVSSAWYSPYDPYHTFHSGRSGSPSASSALSSRKPRRRRSRDSMSLDFGQPSRSHRQLQLQELPQGAETGSGLDTANLLSCPFDSSTPIDASLPRFAPPSTRFMKHLMGGIMLPLSSTTIAWQDSFSRYQGDCPYTTG